MAINDVLKSYLISLGYEVDSKAYNQFTSTLRKAETEVTKHSGKVSSAFTKAGLAYVSAIGTIAASTGLLLKSLASQEMEYQKTALTLHMAKDAAKQYSIALKVLGEPPEMIAWLPVLREQYRVLRKDSQALELPKAYTEGVHELEAMNLEFKRLKQESMYALQWIGFSIMKHLAGPLEKARMNFKMFNDRLIQQMPVLTSHIGGMFKSLLDILGNLGKSFVAIGEQLGKFWDLLSPTTKGILGIAILTFLFSKAGPFGKAVIAIGAATFAASQFWSAMEGKETAIPVEYIHKAIQAFDGLARGISYAASVTMVLWDIFKGGWLIIKQFGKGFDYASARIRLFTLETFGGSKEEIANQKLFTEKMRARSEAGQKEMHAVTREQIWKDMEWVNDVLNNWGGPEGIGLTSTLYRKSKGKISWGDKRREEQTQQRINEKQKESFIPPIGYWGKESPTAGINYGMKGIEKYSSIIEEASKTFGVPAELIKAMIKEESGGKAGAVSPKGARGLMQLMPKTAAGLGIPLSDIEDPQKNIFGGTELIGSLLKKYGGNMELALAAYNAGEGAVSKYGGIPPYRETQNYVKQVMGSYRAYREAAGTSIQGGIHVSVGPINVSGEGKEAGQKVAEGVVSGMKNNEYIGFLFSGVVPSNYSPIIGPAVQRPTGG